MKFKNEFRFSVIIFIAIIFSQNLIAQKKDMVLIPGLGCKAEVWNSTIGLLKNNYNYAVFGIDGFGEKTADSILTLQSVTEKLINFISKNKLQNPVLVGHSFGGYLALYAASQNPDLFSKLIIIDSYPFTPAAMNPQLTEEIMKQQTEIIKTNLMQMSDDQFKAAQYANLAAAIYDSTKIQQVLNWVMNSNRKSVVDAMCEMLTHDLRNVIGNIKTPTLVLGTWKSVEHIGLTKQAVEKNFNDQYKEMKNCTIKVSDTSKHFMMFDDLQNMTSEIIGFVK